MPPPCNMFANGIGGLRFVWLSPPKMTRFAMILTLWQITDTCTANPFATACAPFATQYETARETRIALCADGMEMDNQLCMETEVKAITDALYD